MVCEWSLQRKGVGCVCPMRKLILVLMILLLLIVLVLICIIIIIIIKEYHFQPYKRVVVPPLLLASYHFFLELVQHVRLDPNWVVQTCAITCLGFIW